jgi:hypothetical protein
VRKGELYDPRKVKEGVDLVKAEYARKGFSQCEIVPRLQTDEAAPAARADAIPKVVGLTLMRPATFRPSERHAVCKFSGTLSLLATARRSGEAE